MNIIYTYGSPVYLFLRNSHKLHMENAGRHKELFKKISAFLEKEGATKVAVFGSCARGEERPERDIDLLVEFFETKGLLILVKIK